jgi:hypothetical protein
MRLSVPVSVIVLLAASMPAFAAPTDSSNTASQAYPQLEQRSPLFGIYGFIAKELFKGGEVRSSAALASDHRAEHKRFGVGYLRL